MTITIVEEAPTAAVLKAYASVSIAFRVDSRFRVDVLDSGLGGFRLRHEPVTPPYTKDYDRDEHPAHWAERWDISNWQVFSAYDEGNRVGGAVAAFDTEGVWFLEGRQDVAALWDLRVGPAERRNGVGSALFKAAAGWAKDRNCRRLKIETQNVNVNACRFYAALGCELGEINRLAYRDSGGLVSEEVQLVWWLALDEPSGRV